MKLLVATIFYDFRLQSRKVRLRNRYNKAMIVTYACFKNRSFLKASWYRRTAIFGKSCLGSYQIRQTIDI